VTALFGDNETNEGAIAQLLTGPLPSASKGALFVGESQGVTP